MENNFWNQRYAENETVYGPEPNVYFRNFLGTQKPGSILLPAEGEGRNAIYAASLGWETDAFDFSPVAREKALKRAKELDLNINYFTSTIEEYTASKCYDVVALIYVHLPEGIRQQFHKEIISSLKPGGYVVMEAFSKDQINNTSGGPKELSMLYEVSMIRKDFPSMQIINLAEKTITLDEGPFHKGPADVVQMIAQKL